MTPIVIDTETTGMRDDDEIVEIAAVRGPEDWAHSLCRPRSRPISFGAMATHHITPQMVEDAPRMADALRLLQLDLPPHDAVLVMHNAEYDRRYLPPYLRELPWICTYRCALHLCPDAESHSNGALWYELGLSRKLPEEAGSSPHRALFDALMTHDILEWMIRQVQSLTDDEEGHVPTREDCLRRLTAITQQPVLLRKVRFGKHQGSLWQDVPLDYLQWVLRQDFDADVIHTARHWLNNDPAGYFSEQGDR